MRPRSVSGRSQFGSAWVPQPNAANSSVSVGYATRPNDGTTACPVTVVVRDCTGAVIVGATVTIAVSGPGDAPSDNTVTQPATTTGEDGTATGSFKSTRASVKTISAVANGIAVTATASCTVYSAGTIDRTTSTVSVASPSAAAGGAAVTVTLQAKDSAGNNLTAGGSTVVFSHSGGTSVVTISATTDVGNGTYTATITPTTAGTATTLSATIGGAAVTTTMPTFTVTASGVATLAHFDFESGSNGDVLNLTSGGVRLYADGYTTISTAIARSGTRSARLAQGWKAPSESGTNTKLNFSGLANLSEVWASYYVYMPNGSESPSIGPTVTKQNKAQTGIDQPSNDKFLRIWGGTEDDYGTAGSKCGGSLWATEGQDKTATDGYGYLHADAHTVSDTGEAEQAGSYLFVQAANLGRWVRVRFHVKVATAADNDGVVEFWVDDTRVISETSLSNYPPSGVRNYYSIGSLFGAGCHFQSGQMIYIDDLDFYDTNPGW